jgi:DNA-binding transcriptional LysR family regulator
MSGRKTAPVSPWAGLEVRHLAALKAIAEEGTFARAAARLGYTQSAVSQQIAALDRIVGTPMFERLPGTRRATLTLAGELVLRHAEAVLARVHAARTDIQSLADGVVGSLRVGTYESAGARILPDVLRQFGSAWPQIQVTLQESAADTELFALVERGDLDLTFAVLPPIEGPFTSIGLTQDPYVLVVAADSPLASSSDPVTLEDIVGLPLIGFRSCRNQPRLESYLHARGIEPVVFRSDHNATVQGLVATGVGVALVARLTMDPANERTELLELQEPLPPRLIGIAWHRDRNLPPAAAAFVEIAQAVCAGVAMSDGAPNE